MLFQNQLLHCLHYTEFLLLSVNVQTTKDSNTEQAYLKLN